MRHHADARDRLDPVVSSQLGLLGQAAPPFGSQALLACLLGRLYDALLVMQEFLDECLAQPSFSKQSEMLERMVRDPALHSRFLNTLARLEYVGVRKILKSRRAERLDLEGLRHILEESVHALRLKKFAHAVAPPGARIETFSNEHTLEGDAAERYFQSVDRAATEATGDNAEACYWLTSTAIEIRARSFYPTYQRVLRESGSSISVLSIIADEKEHLLQMSSQLPRHMPAWRPSLRRVMQVEESAFCTYLEAVQRVLGDAPRGASELAAGLR